MSENPARILIIDDEQLVLEVLASFLEDSGFSVLQANNGALGLDLISWEQPDLVMCDLRMPDMDGLNVLEQITRDYPELPVLVVSGLGGMSDAIQALKLGAWDTSPSRLRIWRSWSMLSGGPWNEHGCGVKTVSIGNI